MPTRTEHTFIMIRQFVDQAAAASTEPAQGCPA